MKTFDSILTFNIFEDFQFPLKEEDGGEEDEGEEDLENRLDLSVCLSFRPELKVSFFLKVLFTFENLNKCPLAATRRPRRKEPIIISFICSILQTGFSIEKCLRYCDEFFHLVCQSFFGLCKTFLLKLQLQLDNTRLYLF